MKDLERRLRALDVEWPATPDLAGAVAAHIGAGERRTSVDEGRSPLSRTFGRWPAWAMGLLLVLVLLGAAMAVPPARSALLEVLGLKGARIERREPVATPRPLPPGLGAGLGLGERVTAAQAEARAGFRPGPPRSLPEPEAVYFAREPPGGMVSYVYGPGNGVRRAPETGVGLLVTEFVARASPYIQKAAGPGTRIVPVRAGADRGYWLGGRPHGFAYADRDGTVAFGEQRLAAPTLMLEHDGLLLRLEGRLTRARAIAIARSIAARR